MAVETDLEEVQVKEEQQRIPSLDEEEKSKDGKVSKPTAPKASALPIKVSSPHHIDALSGEEITQ